MPHQRGCSRQKRHAEKRLSGYQEQKPDEPGNRRPAEADRMGDLLGLHAQRHRHGKRGAGNQQDDQDKPGHQRSPDEGGNWLRSSFAADPPEFSSALRPPAA
ncbi:MAG: hypothetical protein CML29_07905 [Rhizobiales bacterium]|nr:hypothetical protein [Hyphomicrobiales bacterium]